MAEDKRKKKRGRSKVFRSCFRSFAVDSSGSKSDGLDSKNRRFVESCRTGKELVPDCKLVNGGGDRDGVCFATAKRPSHRRRFSRILKTVLFDSMMTKKIRRSSSKSSVASDTSASSSSSSEKIGRTADDINGSGKECTDLEDSRSHSNLFSSSSRTTLSSASTSSSSSINSNSRLFSDQKASSRLDSVDTRQIVQSNPSISKKSNDSLHLKRQDSSISLPSAKQKPINSIPKSSSYQRELSRLDSRTSVSSISDKIKPAGENGSSIHWCLSLLLSLVVLVIWGRIFSILCTSISFYFIPCRRLKRVNSATNTAEFIDFDSDQYKKRVIMAGLLERTRNPLR